MPKASCKRKAISAVTGAFPLIIRESNGRVTWIRSASSVIVIA